ncbi:biopolymer transporter ExbD [Thermodesulfobacteriota bacterium]
MESLAHGRRLTLDEAEVNLTPIMCLFIVLVPLLVLEAVFERIATLDIHLPPSSAISEGDVEDDDEETGIQEIQILVEPGGLVLNATMTHTPQGGALDVYQNESVTISLKDNNYDLDMLRESVLSLKTRYPKHKKVILVINNTILYDDIIQVMDTCRENAEDEAGIIKRTEIFPDVALSEKFDDSDTKLEGLRLGTAGVGKGGE